jgi:hypothetical protein
VSKNDHSRHRIIKRSQVTKRHLRLVPPLEDSALREGAAPARARQETIGKLIATTALMADSAASKRRPNPDGSITAEGARRTRRVGRWGWLI